MKSPKAMKRCQRKKTTLFSLPQELVIEVVAQVASSSFADLFAVKLSCKACNKIAKDNYVYGHISLDNFPIVAWREMEKHSQFLNKCKESKNPEALYRRGVIDYFGGRELESAVKCLKEAANEGHLGALYALGVIFMFCGGEEVKQKGTCIISDMKKSETLKRRVKECRDNLKRIIRTIWVKNPIFLGKERPSSCCSMQQQQKKRKPNWSMVDISEEDNIICNGCTCDEEVELIWNSLPHLLP